MNCLAIIISVISLLISIAEFWSERNRNRSEATIHAFDKLQSEIFSGSKENLAKLTVIEAEKIVAQKKSGDIDEQFWAELTYRMSLIEHFAVGINAKVYDLKVLNSMAGNLIIRLYNVMLPIIKYKKSKPDGKYDYIEFEKMKDKIIKFRKRKGQRVDYNY